MPTIIVPVGFENGARWRAGQPTIHEVMLPDSAAALPPDAHAVWLAAFTDVDAHAALGFTRAKLLEMATALGIPDAGELTHRLMESRVLAEYDPAEPAGFFDRHRLYPLADGLGNTKEEPEVFRIAREGRLLLTVNVAVYAVWSTSLYFSSLFEGIAKYAAAIGVSAAEVADMVATALPVIVANRCGFLQPT